MTKNELKKNLSSSQNPAIDFPDPTQPTSNVSNVVPDPLSTNNENIQAVEESQPVVVAPVTWAQQELTLNKWLLGSTTGVATFKDVMDNVKNIVLVLGLIGFLYHQDSGDWYEKSSVAGGTLVLFLVILSVLVIMQTYAVLRLVPSAKKGLFRVISIVYSVALVGGILAYAFALLTSK